MSSEVREEQIPGTIWLALKRAADVLGRAEVDSPRLTAEVLMAHVLGRDRTGILAHIQDSLAPEAYRLFEALVHRRAAGEPLQYLTGEREFFGLPFLVTSAVLIPRPETEILVEKAVELARARAGEIRFADIGTGTGCIAVSFAHAVARARGWATDVSLDALGVARENAGRLGIATQIEFVCCDLLECFASRPLFDLILCNPPYVAGSDAGSLPVVVRDHEPHQALYGGASGLEIHRRVIPQAAPRLLPGGRLLLEIGSGQASEVAELVERAGLEVNETVPDLRGIPRCVVASRAT